MMQQDILIAVIGVTGAGKTTFVKRATGREDLEVGEGLSSCTQEVQIAEVIIGDKRVKLIDTPGFDDTERTDSDILQSIANYLAEMYHDERRLNGVILLQSININRILGSERRRTRLFEKVCGPEAYGNIVIATTMWSELGNGAVGLQRMKERIQGDSFWGPMVEKGACVVKHDDSPSSARKIVEMLVNKSAVTLQMQQELVHNGGKIGQTSAGKQLNEDLGEVCARYEREMEELRRESSQCVEELKGLQDKMEDLRREREELKHSKVNIFDELVAWAPALIGAGIKATGCVMM